MKMLKPRLTAMSTSRTTVAELPAPSKSPGYRIKGYTLMKIRDQYRREHPLCVHCLAVGRVTAWQELDHIVPLHKGGTDTPSNRQGLCKECHAIKTLEDLKP